MQNHVVKLLKDEKKLASVVGANEYKKIMEEIRKIAQTLHTNSVSDLVLSNCNP
jgi:hypothetical protein